MQPRLTIEEVNTALKAVPKGVSAEDHFRQQAENALAALIGAEAAMGKWQDALAKTQNALEEVTQDLVTEVAAHAITRHQLKEISEEPVTVQTWVYKGLVETGKATPSTRRRKRSFKTREKNRAELRLRCVDSFTPQLSAWYAARVVKVPKSTTTLGELYADYAATASGPLATKDVLGVYLSTVCGVERRRNGKGIYYAGVELLPKKT